MSSWISLSRCTVYPRIRVQNCNLLAKRVGYWVKKIHMWTKVSFILKSGMFGKSRNQLWRFRNSLSLLIYFFYIFLQDVVLHLAAVKSAYPCWVHGKVNRVNVGTKRRQRCCRFWFPSSHLSWFQSHTSTNQGMSKRLALKLGKNTALSTIVVSKIQETWT